MGSPFAVPWRLPALLLLALALPLAACGYAPCVPGAGAGVRLSYELVRRIPNDPASVRTRPSGVIASLGSPFEGYGRPACEGPLFESLVSVEIRSEAVVSGARIGGKDCQTHRCDIRRGFDRWRPEDLVLPNHDNDNATTVCRGGSVDDDFEYRLHVDVISDFLVDPEVTELPPDALDENDVLLVLELTDRRSFERCGEAWVARRVP
ncbi:MAG: hypothetical protein AAGH15_18730 [Myxococcota bacterium]